MPTTRTAIEVPGIRHTNPIPNACRKGGFVATGSIFGKIPNEDHGTFPESPETQCAAMFENIRRVAEAAGGSIDDIIKLEVWVQDPKFRPIVNQHWQIMFPDEHTRPARHTFISEDLAPGALMQCAFWAVMDTEPDSAA